MRKFSVNVNGTKYEVEVEELDANAVAQAPNPGDTVKEGQQLMILEAMKMENEILAPCAGRISSMMVAKGSSVESGALLCTIA